MPNFVIVDKGGVRELQRLNGYQWCIEQLSENTEAVLELLPAEDPGTEVNHLNAVARELEIDLKFLTITPEEIHFCFRESAATTRPTQESLSRELLRTLGLVEELARAVQRLAEQAQEAGEEIEEVAGQIRRRTVRDASFEQ